MELFFRCFGMILLGTLGVPVLCGLLVDLCYRACYAMMDRRGGRLFWRLTGVIGTPVHELGHALMCLLFCHRIDRVRLWPTREGTAMVEHTYNSKNIYACLGNVWISLGPLFLGLGTLLLLLWGVWPATLVDCGREVSILWQEEGSVWMTLQGAGKCTLRLLQGLWQETTRAWWWRLPALFALFSVAQHVQLSGADVKGMLSGLPYYAVVCAGVAGVLTLLGEDTCGAATELLLRVAQIALLLFGLILVFALLQLTVVILLRLLSGLWHLMFGKRA